MNTRRIIVIGVAAFALLFSLSSRSEWWKFSKDDDTTQQSPVTEIFWEDLVPDDFVQPENPFISMSADEIDRLMDGSPESNAEVAKLQEEFSYAPVNEALDGKRIKIPAYITPLEYNNESLAKEFLLVPYVGACIHTPPPPANQVMHAQVRDAIKIPGIYDPVWAIGVIRTETVTSELAESGYRFEVEQVMPYQQ